MGGQNTYGITLCISGNAPTSWQSRYGNYQHVGNSEIVGYGTPQNATTHSGYGRCFSKYMSQTGVEYNNGNTSEEPKEEE
jgi:hypothetical protein